MKDNLGKDTSDIDNGGLSAGFSTAHGVAMKTGQKQIVTGMDKLVNPTSPTTIDQIFDSSPSRDINEGSVKDQGGISYKGVKEGSKGVFR
jgi:hypothetical protein